jgi:hypothetical protein
VGPSQVEFPSYRKARLSGLGEALEKQPTSTVDLRSFVEPREIRMSPEFAQTCREMTDDKLISAAKRERDLVQEDVDALWAEFRRRNLYASGPYDDVIGAIADIPRPRPLRMNFKGHFMGLLAAGLLGIVGYVAHDQPHLFGFAEWDGAGLVLAIFLMLLVGLLWLWPCLRHRRLVAEGDIAIGQVTEGYHDGSMRYTFATPSGERFSKLGQTFRGADFSPGMKVPVFYNPQKPKGSVALPISFYELAMTRDDSRPGLEVLLLAASIAAIFSLLILFLRHIGRFDLTGYPAMFVSFTLGFAIHAGHRLRRHWWFWATLAPIGAAHVLLILQIHWNERTWVPAQAMTFLCIGDLFVIFLLLGLVARLVGAKAAFQENFPRQPEPKWTHG